MCFCSIVPPHMLNKIVEKGSNEEKKAAVNTLVQSKKLETERNLISKFHGLFQVPTATDKTRYVYTSNYTTRLPGNLVRKEKGQAVNDKAVNEAYDASGATYDFYKKVYGRSSINDHNMPLTSSVHYDRNYMNAFWDGRQMVYGDGDGSLFNRFTISLDVIGHELTHGVTQFEANLLYQDQPGALNEHFSDVMGSLVKQYVFKQTADKADWLIGAELLTKNVKGKALRSMKAPGTAYNDPRLGKDPQPDHMNNYYETQEDDGGVHINSGIPNKAFYLAAINIGGYAWDKAGKIWYLTVKDKVRSNCSFITFASATLQVALELYGLASKEANAVKYAWNQVGLKI